MDVRTCCRRCRIFFRSVKVSTHCLFLRYAPRSPSNPFVPSILFSLSSLSPISNCNSPSSVHSCSLWLPLTLLLFLYLYRYLFIPLKLKPFFWSPCLPPTSTLPLTLHHLPCPLSLPPLPNSHPPSLIHSKDLKATDDSLTKEKMKSIFGKGKAKKDGTESLVKGLPPVSDLQTNIGKRKESYTVLHTLLFTSLFLSFFFFLCFNDYFLLFTSYYLTCYYSVFFFFLLFSVIFSSLFSYNHYLKVYTYTLPNIDMHTN